ncbi:MAG: hypothetical protein O7G87_09270 [bacterium]|nr:hypothetical protein [bacterium]
MYERLDVVKLKSGEEVELGVVMGPDLDWADRIDEDLLGHKGPAWRWGNRQVLTEELDLEAYFYILHRDGVPFANVMNIEYQGIGILGHVFTRPEDRRQGACSKTFEQLMPHFRSRGGRVLILGTGFDSHPYHIYRSFGFEGIEPKSGIMAYYTDSQAAFEEAFFADGPVAVERLGASHYPVTPILFVGVFPGTVRSATMHLFGCSSSEGPLIPLLRDELERVEQDQGVRTAVLKQQETEAVVGIATYDRDAVWPGTCLVDVYCHPNFWGQAGNLLSRIDLPEMHRYVVYCDAGFEAKEQVLTEAGYQRVATLEEWVPADRAVSRFVDVGVWEKR